VPLSAAECARPVTPAAMVVQDQGVQGLHQGGTRMLHVPPSLAYGAKGTPGGPIPGDATLLFSVKLLHVKKAGGKPQAKQMHKSKKVAAAVEKRRMLMKKKMAALAEKRKQEHMEKQHKLHASLAHLI